ncbi:hypothetical protein MKL29_04375 [Streptococcus suis]|nr:hypothetical protein [Streptococcus suis]
MKKSNVSFLIALGFFVIAISPTFGNKYYNLMTGFFLIILGLYVMKKNKK